LVVADGVLPPPPMRDRPDLGKLAAKNALASCFDFFALLFSFRVMPGFFFASRWLLRSFVMVSSRDSGAMSKMDPSAMLTERQDRGGWETLRLGLAARAAQCEALCRRRQCAREWGRSAQCVRAITLEARFQYTHKPASYRIFVRRDRMLQAHKPSIREIGRYQMANSDVSTLGRAQRCSTT